MNDSNSINVKTIKPERIAFKQYTIQYIVTVRCVNVIVCLKSFIIYNLHLQLARSSRH